MGKNKHTPHRRLSNSSSHSSGSGSPSTYNSEQSPKAAPQLMSSPPPTFTRQTSSSKSGSNRLKRAWRRFSVQLTLWDASIQRKFVAHNLEWLIIFILVAVAAAVAPNKIVSLALLAISFAFVSLLSFGLRKDWRSPRTASIRYSLFTSYGIFVVAFSLFLSFSEYFYDVSNRQPSPFRIPGALPPLIGSLGGSSGDVRVLVGPYGAVKAPYDSQVGSFVTYAANAAMAGGDQYVTGDTFSIVIAARDEDDYIAKTIKYTLENTNLDLLEEIIVVDDASNNPVSSLLDRKLTKKQRSYVHVMRFEEKEGLIRARIAGADAARASNIFFMDGHCRPKKGWLDPLLMHLKQNYKRVICPIIEDIKRDTWEDNGTSGQKMMFSWTFEFDWYDDLTEEVPLSSGGILGMTKKWWIESGKYDPGMLEWGGENLEQSFRIWMCGGEILVARNSHVGHIFDRPEKPNPGGSLVRQVQKNQKRAAMVWLDEYYTLFETYHSVVTKLDEGDGLLDRLKLRRDLKCQPFTWYVQKFRHAFERKALLVNEFHHIQHGLSGWCLTAAGVGNALHLEPCDQSDPHQKWQSVSGGRMLLNFEAQQCFDMGNGKGPMLYTCDWIHVFQGLNNNQFIAFDSLKSKRIFNFKTDFRTLTGGDPLIFNSSEAKKSSSKCLTSNFKIRGRKIPKNPNIELDVCSREETLAQTWKWLW